MHPLIIDILSYGWFAFIVWAAVHEWHLTHPASRRRHIWRHRERPDNGSPQETVRD